MVNALSKSEIEHYWDVSIDVPKEYTKTNFKLVIVFVCNQL